MQHPTEKHDTTEIRDATVRFTVKESSRLVGAWSQAEDGRQCLMLVHQAASNTTPYAGYHDGHVHTCPIAITIEPEGVMVQLVLPD